MGLERFHDFIPASEKEKNNTTSASASSHYHGASDTIVRLINESQWLIARRLPVYGAFPWLAETRRNTICPGKCNAKCNIWQPPFRLLCHVYTLSRTLFPLNPQMSVGCSRDPEELACLRSRFISGAVSILVGI